jgi:hypothetical protein
MKPKLMMLLVALGLAVACHREAEKATPADDKEKKAKPRVQQGTNGESIIILDVETQKKMGLQTAQLEAMQLSAEVKAFGRVLDPSAFVTQIADLKAAQITAETSQAELNRLKSLATSDNASPKAVQAAEATTAKDKAQLEAARLKLLASWGPLGSRPDLSALVESLGKLEGVLVQANLPADQSLDKSPVHARILTLAGKEPMQAELVGPATTSDPQTQGRGFLFLVRTNQAALTPGMSITALLSSDEPAEAGLKIPRTAVVQKNGESWIYIKTGEETFKRALVSTDRPVSGGWFVTSLKSGELAVIVGAQEMLSEESNSAD